MPCCQQRERSLLSVTEEQLEKQPDISNRGAAGEQPDISNRGAA